MHGLFNGELGLMISALLLFAGMTDFIIITLFLGRKHLHTRDTDSLSLSPEQKEKIRQRQRSYQVVQFVLTMTGLLLIVAGLYGISMQVMGIL